VTGCSAGAAAGAWTQAGPLLIPRCGDHFPD
jgi:hypothetical protein